MLYRKYRATLKCESRASYRAKSPPGWMHTRRRGIWLRSNRASARECAKAHSFLWFKFDLTGAPYSREEPVCPAEKYLCIQSRIALICTLSEIPERKELYIGAGRSLFSCSSRWRPSPAVEIPYPQKKLRFYVWLYPPAADNSNFDNL